MRRILLMIIAAWCCAQSSLAQVAYPQDYFRNPLNIPILLAGNFGECRPNHFHSGIDIKTKGVENEPVYAAAGGYISRIKTEPGGFGHALYITHPNGYTTLYAHLNNYVPELQQYLRAQQYARKSWTVDVQLQPTNFPVKKGDQIAFSGNTGGSTAPHLHFEIRDSQTEHPLNPQLFGLPINDSLPPVPRQLVVYDGDASIYLQEPAYYTLKKTAAGYTVPGGITLPSSALLFGIVADDFMEGSDNTLNFYTAAWSIDGKQVCSITLDNIGYEETRYLHAYIDYMAKQKTGKWVQLLYPLPGNRLRKIYSAVNPARGVSMMHDTALLQITLTDAAGNKTEIAAALRAGKPELQKQACSRRITPDSAVIFSRTNIRFSFPASGVYDGFCLEDSELTQATGFSGRFRLGTPEVPVHSYFPLFIKPNRPVPFALRSRLALRYSDSKKESGKAALQGEDGWYKADVRAFGEYWLVADTAAPDITAVTPKAALGKAPRIIFKITDNLTSVQKARAELDDQWILLEQHETSWFYEADEHCPKGKHTLVIVAEDENGNVRQRSYNFVRE